MKIFKACIGVVLIIMGIAVGLYVGLWFCFLGGIIQIVGAIENPEGINALAIGIGIIRILCTGIAGWATASLFLIPGVAIISEC